LKTTRSVLAVSQYVR